MMHMDSYRRWVLFGVVGIGLIAAVISACGNLGRSAALRSPGERRSDAGEPTAVPLHKANGLRRRPTTSALRWMIEVGKNASIAGLVPGQVVVAHDAGLVGLDRVTGTELWRHAIPGVSVVSMSQSGCIPLEESVVTDGPDLSFRALSSRTGKTVAGPTYGALSIRVWQEMSSGLILATTRLDGTANIDPGWVMGVDADTALAVWRHRLTLQGGDRQVRAKIRTAGRWNTVYTSKAGEIQGTAGRLYIQNDYALVTLRADTGVPIGFVHGFGKRSASTPASTDGLLYIVQDYGKPGAYPRVHALDAKLNSVWSTTLLEDEDVLPGSGRLQYREPMVAGSTLVVSNVAGGSWGLNRRTGAIAWSSYGLGIPMAAHGNRLYYAGSKGIDIIDAATGHRLSTIEVSPYAVRGIHLEASGTLYFVGYDLQDQSVWIAARLDLNDNSRDEE